MTEGVALGGTLLSYPQMKFGTCDARLGREIIGGLKILPQTGGSPPIQEQLDVFVETFVIRQNPLVFGYVEDSGPTV